jgi:hypothetical protein
MDRPLLHTALQNQLQNRTLTTKIFLDMLINVLQYNQCNIISSEIIRRARSSLFFDKATGRNLFN